MLITKYYYSNPANGTLEEYIPYVGYKVLENRPVPRISICGIFDNETKVLKIGCSRCSTKDKFDKKLGKELAYTRAETNPIITMKLAEGEVLSHVFFDQAKNLTIRILKMKHFKF